MGIVAGEGIPVIRIEDLKSGHMEKAAVFDGVPMKINVCIPTIGRERIYDTINTLLTSTHKKISIVAVVQENKEFADKLKEYFSEHKNVEVIFEAEAKGWAWAQNLVAKRPGALFAIADDIAVCRDTVRTLEIIMQTQFPDGDGVIATSVTQIRHFDCQGFPGAFVMIGDKFISRFPNRLVFCPDYFAHGADPELRNFGISINRYLQAFDAKIIHFDMAASRDPRPKEWDETTKRMRARSQEALDVYWGRQDRGYLWGKNFSLLKEESGRKLKIKVLSRWFNEAVLAPFFLEHYRFADEIIVYLDTATTDKSAEIISKYPKTKIVPCASPGGLNDRYLVDLINRAVVEQDCDWVIYAEADEFIFPRNMDDPRRVISLANGNLIYAHLWQMYRHIDDDNLDPDRPHILQRRHGDPNRAEGINALYRKPIIVKPETRIRWEPGHHAYEPNPLIKVSTTVFDGAHWNLVEYDLACQRRIGGRRNRFSAENKEMGWGRRWFEITESEIWEEFKAHLHDPRLF